jgi:hypothetical protein
MYCSSCGREVAEGKTFCSGCGAPAPAADDQPTAPTQPVVPSQATVPVPTVRPDSPVAPPQPSEPMPAFGFVPPDAPPLSLDLPDPPRRRTGLIVLVVALVVLVIAVAFVVALLLSRGDDSGTTATTVPGVTTTVAGGAETTVTSAGGTTELVDVSPVATSIAASSVLPDQGSTTYDPDNLIDGQADTCWAENASGYGVGEYVEFTWASPVTISQVRIVPGYDKTGGGWDRWVSNGRVRTFDLIFSDGSTESLAVTDTKAPQVLTLGALHNVTWVQFVITGFYEAAEGPHKAEDTSVSELHFWGAE